MYSLDNYQPTHLEKAITQFYQLHRIYSPRDIDLTLFAQDANVHIVFSPRDSKTYEFTNHRYEVIIDNRNPPSQQKIELAHELGHILLHVGRQDFMVDDFRAMQEWQANRFAIFALAPTFMMMNVIEPSNNRHQMILQLTEHFDVPISFMDERLNILEQRLYDFASQRRLSHIVAEDQARYDYTYFHPSNSSIEYLVKNEMVVGRRRRAEI